MREYEFRYVKGHIEVYLNGQFQFSADTKAEAIHELVELESSNEERISA